MKRSYLIIAAAACILPQGIRAEAPWWQELGPVQRGGFAGGFSDEKEISPEEKEVLAKTHFDEWDTYEDQYVKLSFPRHPLVRFRVVKNEAGNGLHVEGGVVTTVDNSFEQAYVLEVGKSTYGVFMLQPAKWLDDGICLCGPMIHSSYQMRDGCLVRYSLLPGGAIKKAQVLGGSMRLMSFEWTHLACPREIYEGLVEGMHLKIPLRTPEKDLREKLVTRYGFSAKAGWLHPGDSREVAVALLGAPREEKDGLVRWQEPSGDYERTISARFEDGRFVNFEGKGIGLASEVPISGTLDWVSFYTDDSDRHSDAENKASRSATPPSTEELLAALRSLEPECKGYRWNEWCIDFLWLMKNREVKDEAMLAKVAARPALTFSFEVLREAKYADLKSWTSKRLDDLIAMQPPVPSEEDEDSESRYFEQGRASELGDILEWQFESDPGTAQATVARLIHASNLEWSQMLIEKHDLLSPELNNRIALQILDLAI